MAKAATPADTLLTDVLAQAVTPSLKAAGFRKSGTSYHRRHGRTVQAVNIQSSHGSTEMEKVFYVNTGIAFDEVCALAGVPVLDRPKESECDDRGTRDRLEAMISGAPASWELRAGMETRETIAALRQCMEQLVIEMDKLDGLSAYRAHRWFDRVRPAQVNAQVLYLLGDHDGARREVLDLAQLFADRRNANRAEWWIDRLRLTRLSIAEDSVVRDQDSQTS